MPTKTDNDTLALACERYLRASGQEKDIVSMVKRMREVEQETELRIGLAIAGSLYDRVAYGN